MIGVSTATLQHWQQGRRQARRPRPRAPPRRLESAGYSGEGARQRDAPWRVTFHHLRRLHLGSSPHGRSARNRAAGSGQTTGTSEVMHIRHGGVSLRPREDARVSPLRGFEGDFAFQVIDQAIVNPLKARSGLPDAAPILDQQKRVFDRRTIRGE